MSLPAGTAFPVRLFAHATDENSTASAVSPAAPLATMIFPSDLAARRGLLGSTITITNKAGRNPDVDTTSTPEDIWNGGGVYPGFPTGSPEPLQLFSSSASDTGTVSLMVLASSASTAWAPLTVQLNGTTPVVTAGSYYRCHMANYSSGTATAFNVGDITVRHSVTTANVFVTIPAGSAQSNSAVFTIPASCTGYVTEIHGQVRATGGVTAYADCELWVRTAGVSPRLRRPFTLSNTFYYQQSVLGALEFPALSDITIRVSTVTISNTEVTAGFDIVVIPN